LSEYADYLSELQSGSGWMYTQVKHFWLSAAILSACSPLSWAIYGPSLTRADTSVSVRACQEGHFSHSQDITRALQSQDPNQMFEVLGDALKEWRATPSTSALYPARAFCIHELVPNGFPVSTSATTLNRHTNRPPTVQILGVEYVFYEPDARWILTEDPVDLNKLATQLNSPWGRQAFLMMTQLGWSQGRCQEGADQFRKVIKEGETFLVEYPNSEVSAAVSLAVANAYATWWNLSRSNPNPPYSSPEMYKDGAGEAREKAINLYESYLDKQTTSIPEVESRLKELRDNPKGSNTYDYFCSDYED